MKLEMPTENSRPSSLYVRLNFSARLRSSKGKKKKKGFPNLTDKHATSQKQTGLQFPPPKSEHKSIERFN